ncbi:MAG: 50S ribosomal protein L10 [Candidatus Norongarragalinales archaeon]
MVLSKKEKQALVKKMAETLRAASVIAVASNAYLPGKQYGAIKKKTRDKVKFLFARQTLLRRALEQAKPEAKQLEKYFCNGTVLLVTELDAFRLYKLFKQAKSKTIAKAGQLAPHDIVVPAGETNLAPGPVLTELKQAKIDARIQGPKIVIQRDAVVAKKGEPISAPVASILAKLGIEPMELMLRIAAVWDCGTLYEESVLNVDEEAFKSDLVQAARQALNLCVFAEIYNDQSAPLILAKAAREANAIDAIVKSKAPKTEGLKEKNEEAKPAEAAGQLQQL